VLLGLDVLGDRIAPGAALLVFGSLRLARQLGRFGPFIKRLLRFVARGGRALRLLFSRHARGLARLALGYREQLTHALVELRNLAEELLDLPTQ